MPRSALRVVAWGLGGTLLAILLLLALGLAVLTMLNWSVARPYVESALGEALQREVTLEALEVDPGATTTISLRGLRIANPEWAERKDLARVEELRIALRSWPLLTGRLEILEVRAMALVVNLERNAKGQATWSVGAAADTAGEIAAPETRHEVPEIDRLLVEDGVVRYRDAVRGLSLDGEIATATGDADGSDRVDLTARGRLEEEPVSLTFKGGSFTTLRDTAKPFPVILNLQFADTVLAVEGTIREPLQLRALDLAIRLEGPTLAQLYHLLGLPLQDTRSYRLTGSLSRDGERWRVTDLHGTVGESDLSGQVTLDQAKEPPLLEASLVSSKLDFADLAGFIGAQEDATAEDSGAEESFFPRTDVARERLRAMDMDVRFEGEEVISELLPINRISARLRLREGRVVVEPLRFDVADGTLSGALTLSARGEVPEADVDLSFEELDLKPFFKGSDFAQEMAGRISGHLRLMGEGRNLDQMMANARGQGWVAMQDGTISGLVVEAIGLDVAEALVLAVGEDARVAIRCGRIDLEAEAGNFTAKRAIIDTTDSTLLARGTVDMAAETMDLQVEARPKDFSLIDMAAPVALSGSFKDPSVSIGGLDPLPFLELGQATDLECKRLLDGTLSPGAIRQD